MILWGQFCSTILLDNLWPVRWSARGTEAVGQGPNHRCKKTLAITKQIIKPLLGILNCLSPSFMFDDRYLCRLGLQINFLFPVPHCPATSISCFIRALLRVCAFDARDQCARDQLFHIKCCQTSPHVQTQNMIGLAGETFTRYTIRGAVLLINWTYRIISRS